MAYDPELRALLAEAAERLNSNGESDDRRFQMMEIAERTTALAARAKTHRIAIRVAQLLAQHGVLPEASLRLSDSAAEELMGDEATSIETEVSGWVLDSARTVYTRRNQQKALLARWLLLRPDGRLTVATIDSPTADISYDAAVPVVCDDFFDDLDDDPQDDPIAWNEPFGDPNEALIAPAASETWYSVRPLFGDESGGTFVNYRRFNAAGIETRIQQALGDAAIRLIPSLAGE